MAFYNKYKIHKVQQNQRWDDLARIYYGDCFKFAQIIEANSSIPISPFLPVDAQIIIPFFENETTVNEDLPIWKQ